MRRGVYCVRVDVDYGHEPSVGGLCQDGTLHFDVTEKYRTLSDEYFALRLNKVEAGFTAPTTTCNTHRHRTVIAQLG